MSSSAEPPPLPLGNKQDQKSTSVNHDFPTQIVKLIIDRLPLRDAVRSSVLSKQWRNKWKYLSRLIIHRDFYYRAWDKREEYYINIITTILSSQLGHIREVYIYFNCPLSEHDPNIVEKWAQFATKNNSLTNLTLQSPGHVIELPICLFSRLDVTHLSLLDFVISSPNLSFEGFPRLVSLTMRVSSHMLDKLERLISACPELRMLDLHVFPIIDVTSSAPPNYFCISAPKLGFLKFETVALPRLCDATTNIKTASLFMFNWEFNDPMESFERIELIENLCNVEDLRMDMDFFKFLSYGEFMSNKLPSLLVRLKTLTIKEDRPGSYRIGRKEILLVLCLMRSSPNLQHLDLFGGGRSISSRKDFEFTQDCSFKSLQTVGLWQITNLSFDLKVIKFILACSPVLKTMSINPRGVLKVAKRTQLIEKVLECCRASPEVEIDFTSDHW